MCWEKKQFLCRKYIFYINWFPFLKSSSAFFVFGHFCVMTGHLATVIGNSRCFSPLRLENVHFRHFHRGNVVTDTGNTRPPFYLTVFFRHIEKLSFLYSLYDTSCCKNFAAFLFCNNILWLQHRRVWRQSPHAFLKSAVIFPTHI